MGGESAIIGKDDGTIRKDRGVKIQTIVVDESGFKKKRRGLLKAGFMDMNSKKLRKIHFP